MQEIGFYNRATVLSLTTWSSATLWRRIRAKEFPEPVRISLGRVAWSRAVVNQWLREHGGGDIDEAA